MRWRRNRCSPNPCTGSPRRYQLSSWGQWSTVLPRSRVDYYRCRSDPPFRAQDGFARSSVPARTRKGSAVRSLSHTDSSLYIPSSGRAGFLRLALLTRAVQGRREILSAPSRVSDDARAASTASTGLMPGERAGPDRKRCVRPLHAAKPLARQALDLERSKSGSGIHRDSRQRTNAGRQSLTS